MKKILIITIFLTGCSIDSISLCLSEAVAQEQVLERIEEELAYNCFPSDVKKYVKAPSDWPEIGRQCYKISYECEK